MMIKEFFEIIGDFYKMRKGLMSEKILIIGIPVFVGILALVVGIIIPKKWEVSILMLMEDFINQIITVLALFISFSIAYIGMIISSNSDSVTKMKKYDSRFYKLKGENVKIFQALHCLMTYTVVVEVIYLMLVFVEKMIVYLLDGNIIRVLLCFNLALLVHLVILICIQIKDIYFSFWKV